MYQREDDLVMKRVAFLTSGGDCQALNATMRGVAKALYAADKDIEIYGILEGYKGLIYGNYRKWNLLIFPGFSHWEERFLDLPDSHLSI